MTRYRLVILDANVVIHLHEIGLWSAMASRREILLSRTVLEAEALHYPTPEGNVLIDLNEDVRAGRVQVVDVSFAEASAFRALFDPVYTSLLDPGETESLAHLHQGGRDDIHICSADGIVYRVLPHLGLAEQGVSLEEILHSLGMSRVLKWPYTRRFREHWTQQGVQEMLSGIGRKR